MIDSAFFDRFHAYIPGWEIPKMRPEFFTNQYGLIVDYLAETHRILGALPTIDTIILERFFDDSGGMQLVLHAPFGSRVNRAWALALSRHSGRSDVIFSGQLGRIEVAERDAFASDAKLDVDSHRRQVHVRVENVGLCVRVRLADRHERAALPLG